VIESNEVNNCLASTSTVQIALPDLVEAVVSTPLATITPGASFLVNDRVQNSGAPAGASRTQFYISTAPQKNGSEILLGGRLVDPLTASGQANRSQVDTSVTIPAGTPLGTYYLIACADDLNQVAESSEANNCRSATNTLQVALPDLVQISISGPSAVSVGVAFQISDRVDNRGVAPSLPSTTRYYLSTTPQINGTPVLLGSRSISILGTNGPGSRSTSLATPVTVPSGTALGTYYLIACADDLNSNNETNETNNCLAASATVNVN